MNGIRQCLHFVIKNGFYLPSLYAGEPFQKLLRRGTIFEIFEKRRYRMRLVPGLVLAIGMLVSPGLAGAEPVGFIAAFEGRHEPRPR